MQRILLMIIFIGINVDYFLLLDSASKDKASLIFLKQADKVASTEYFFILFYVNNKIWKDPEDIQKRIANSYNYQYKS